MWEYRGQKRPEFAERPGDGQESVWDYPRPPQAVGDSRLVEVKNDGSLIASTSAAIRVCETASPPTFYIPPNDVRWSTLVSVKGHSFCEWKGAASYWALAADPTGVPVAWSYDRPTPGFAVIASYVSFYPGRLECYVDGERVLPQPGGFYGGWVTSEVVGPFKGEPGTGHW